MALGAGGLGLLTSCASGGATSGSSTAGLTLPHQVRFKGPAPSLPTPSDGTQYFYNYPANPVQSVHTAPMSGGTVSANLLITGVVPTPEGQNLAWQEIEKRLGAKLQLDMATSADYATKLATVIASGNIPDFLFYAPTVTPIPSLLQFLESSCADLTPYLSGKGIEEWPNLANLPTAVWRTSAINGHLYGLPSPNSLLANGPLYYADMLSGDEAAPKNATDFMNLLKDQTMPSAGRWGFCGVQNGVFAMNFLQEMWRVPNNWKVSSGGKFTNAIETSENKAALSFNRQLYAAGVFYPGSQGLAEPARKTVFFSGRCFMSVDGFLNYPGFQLNSTRPGAKVRYMIPPGHDGGKGTAYLGRGFYGMSFMKKSSEKRIKELLGVANFFAAPFGTTEDLLKGYGVEGRDYTLDPQGNPIETTTGKAEVSRNPPGGSPWQYIVESPLTIYSNTKEYVQIQHQAEVDLLAIGVSDPSLGLYSQTDSTRGTTIMQTVTDAFTDIVAGRRPMSDYDSIVRAWRSSGGDQIRKEYQQAWHSSHKA